MAIVHECNDDVNAIKTLNIQEKKYIWDMHMKECKYALGQNEFDHIVKEFYGDINSSFSNTDLESSSLGSLV